MTSNNNTEEKYRALNDSHKAKLNEISRLEGKPALSQQESKELEQLRLAASEDLVEIGVFGEDIANQSTAKLSSQSGASTSGTVAGESPSLRAGAAAAAGKNVITILVIIPVGSSHVSSLPDLMQIYLAAAEQARGSFDIVFYFFVNELRQIAYDWSATTPTRLETGDCFIVEHCIVSSFHKRTPIALIRRLAHNYGVAAWKGAKKITHLLMGDADCAGLPNGYFKKFGDAIVSAGTVPHIIYGGLISSVSDVCEFGSVMDFVARKKLCQIDPKHCYFGEPNTLFSTGLVQKPLFPPCIDDDQKSLMAWETVTMRKASTNERKEMFIDNPVITGPYYKNPLVLKGELDGKPNRTQNDFFDGFSIVWSSEDNFRKDFETSRRFTYSHASDWDYYYQNLGKLDKETYDTTVAAVRTELMGKCQREHGSLRLRLADLFVEKFVFIRSDARQWTKRRSLLELLLDDF